MVITSTHHAVMLAGKLCGMVSRVSAPYSRTDHLNAGRGFAVCAGSCTRRCWPRCCVRPCRSITPRPLAASSTGLQRTLQTSTGTWQAICHLPLGKHIPISAHKVHAPTFHCSIAVNCRPGVLGNSMSLAVTWTHQYQPNLCIWRLYTGHRAELHPQG